MKFFCRRQEDMLNSGASKIILLMELIPPINWRHELLSLPTPLLPNFRCLHSHTFWPLYVEELTLKESLNLSNVVGTSIIYHQKLITTLVL